MAFIECQQFYKKHKEHLTIQDFIKEQKKTNKIITDIHFHKTIPSPKYPPYCPENEYV